MISFRGCSPFLECLSIWQQVVFTFLAIHIPAVSADNGGILRKLLVAQFENFTATALLHFS